MGHSTESVYIPKGFGEHFDVKKIIHYAQDAYSSDYRSQDSYSSTHHGDSSLGWGKTYLHPTPVSRHEASRLGHSNNGDFLVNSDRNVIFPILEDSNMVSVTKQVKVRVTAEQAQDIRMHPNNYAGLVAYILTDDFVSNVKVVKTPAPKKPVASATEGKTVTVYKLVVFVSYKHGADQDEDVNHLNGEYVTQAEARQAALRVASNMNAKGKPFTRIEVHPHTKRDTGDKAVVVITQEDKNGEVVLEYTVLKAKPNVNPDGWQVFFDVHH